MLQCERGLKDFIGITQIYFTFKPPFPFWSMSQHYYFFFYPVPVARNIFLSDLPSHAPRTTFHKSPFPTQSVWAGSWKSSSSIILLIKQLMYRYVGQRGIGYKKSSVVQQAGVTLLLLNFVANELFL